jgi:uncharacterized protein (DUF433 family)
MSDDTEDPVFLDLVRNEYQIYKLVETYLHRDLEYDRSGAFRWHPMTRRRRVMIDRRIRFGAPIVPEGVPTVVLAAAAQAEGSVRAAAEWYHVSEQSVRDAVRFESR